MVDVAGPAAPAADADLALAGVGEDVLARRELAEAHGAVGAVAGERHARVGAVAQRSAVSLSSSRSASSLVLLYSVVVVVLLLVRRGRVPVRRRRLGALAEGPDEAAARLVVAHAGAADEAQLVVGFDGAQADAHKVEADELAIEAAGAAEGLQVAEAQVGADEELQLHGQVEERGILVGTVAEGECEGDDAGGRGGSGRRWSRRW